MNSSDHNKFLTELQSLIFQLSTHKFPKVDSTFFALFADSDVSKKNDKQFSSKNTHLMDRFGLAILGKEEHTKSGSFQQITVESATLWVKESEIDNKSIRLVFFPAIKWDLEGEKGAVSYKKMVMQFFLFNSFLKPELTTKKTLVSFSYMSGPQQEIGDEVATLKLLPHIKKISKDLKKTFKLDLAQIRQKVIYVIYIKAKREEVILEDEIKNENKIYVLTNDEHPHPLFALDPVDKTFGLKTEPTDLLKKDNFATTAQCHLHFHYNEFVNFKSNRIADSNLSIKISDQIWAVILAIIYPIYKIKQELYKKYNFQTIEPKGHQIPTGYPKEDLWRSEYEIRTNFKTFNEIFRFNQWKEMNNEPRDDLEEDQLVKPQEQRLVEFTKMIDLNTDFLHQEQNFTHAIIINQINQLNQELSAQNRNIQSESDQSKRFLLERKILEFSKIIVRFIESLKNHKLFSHLLVDYEAKFYEHLLTVYTEAHDEFCRANKLIFGKLYDLITKVTELKSVKPQTLKVLKSEAKDVKLERKNIQSIEQARKKKKMLQILLNLLQQNETNEEDKEVKKKILVIKYDLVSTLKTLAMLGDFGNGDNRYLKEALKIVFVDLYKHLFIDNKNFATEYPTGVGFNDVDLLKEASGLLKALGRIELSIELQKRMCNHSVVENYYNRWLMKYRIDMGEKEVAQMRKIFYEAICYFKAIYLPTKVSFYYGLLVQSGMSSKERANFNLERLDYEIELNDPVTKKKQIESAKTKEFPLVQKNGKDTVRDIVNLCSLNEKKNNMNSLIIEQ